MISSINRDGTVRDRLSITLDGMRAFYADMPGIEPRGKGPVRLGNEESAVS